MRTIHVISSLLEGGTEQGVLNLIKGGFYHSTDLKIIELVQGRGSIREKIIQEIGSDNVIPLISRTDSSKVIDKDLPKLAWRMGKAFGVLKPDTIVLSQISALMVGRVVAMAYPKIKVISFEHDSGRRRRHVEMGLRAMSWRSDAVFGDTAETLVQRRFAYSRHKPAHVVPLTILETGKPRDGRVPDVIRILSLGRLSPQKNYAELIHAVAELVKEGRNLELVIAGDGPERPALERIVKELDRDNPGFAGRIHMPAFVSDENALKALRDRAHIYVQPSVFEGFCLATAEAMAAGLPIAATDFAGVRDYGNADNMKKIRGTSRKNIAEALRPMITHYAEIAPVMSAAAIKTAEQRFSLSAVTSAWSSAIEEFSSPRAPARSRFLGRGLTPLVHTCSKR